MYSDKNDLNQFAHLTDDNGRRMISWKEVIELLGNEQEWAELIGITNINESFSLQFDDKSLQSFYKRIMERKICMIESGDKPSEEEKKFDEDIDKLIGINEF